MGTGNAGGGGGLTKARGLQAARTGYYDPTGANDDIVFALDELTGLREAAEAGDYSGIDPGRPMSMKDALEFSPSGSSDKAALVYELRRRGYDVRDNPRVSGGAFDTLGGTDYKAIDSYRKLGSATRDMPEGSRWVARVPLKGRGSQNRSIVIEKLPGGKIQIVDPQSGATGVRWIGQINMDAPVRMRRMDNAEVKYRNGAGQGYTRLRDRTAVDARSRELARQLGRMGVTVGRF